MSAKLADARAILAALGMPAGQQTETAAYTLLALAYLRPAGRWADAGQPQLRIHDILAFIRQEYAKTIAANTRETYRKNVLHQQALEAVLAGCKLHRVYVSAFPTFRVFKRYAADIAWDSEVWVAEVPHHMIHFNGPKFSARSRRDMGRRGIIAPCDPSASASSGPA